MAVFSNKFLKNIQLSYRSIVGHVPTPEKWVFIVGCYNSGTTLLHRILSKHQEIGSMPFEGQVLSSQFPTPREFGLPRLWAIQKEHFHLNKYSTPASTARRLMRQWGHEFNYPNRPILLEKSITNTARIPWLNKHFNNAYFIGMIRNGYAVSEGIHRKAGHEYRLCARQWAVSNEIMLNDLEQVPNKLLITYEDFTRDPSGTLEIIANFLDIDNTFAEKGLTSNEWHIHGVISKVQNMNESSISRLKAEEKVSVENSAHDMLVKLGYLKETNDTNIP